MISINQMKAEEITKNRIRAVRDPLLAEQDVAFQRALENGADVAPIVERKNQLRDATQIAEGKTVEELTQIIKDVEANGLSAQ